MKIAIAGCSGRMGIELVRAIHTQPEKFQLLCGIVSPQSASIGKDIGELAGMSKIGIFAVDKIIAGLDIMIDFSTPEATMANAEYCSRNNLCFISGVTGLKEKQLETMQKYAQYVPMLYSPNMSIGVNLLITTVERMAAALDPEYDIEILEMHHNQKADAPSGTALMLGQAAARSKGLELQAHMVKDRQSKRKSGDIGFASLRGGDTIGEHKVIFAGPGERIELGHVATSRALFALGALRAAEWLVKQRPGRLHGMQDLLGYTISGK